MKQTSSATTHPTSVAPVVTAAVVATSVPAAAAAENMFNNPIVATTEGTENATPPAVEKGSAFSFMGNNNGKIETPREKPNFDPLLNNDNNSNNNNNTNGGLQQLSQPNMGAMAPQMAAAFQQQQQQLLMMQAQMQQMQMGVGGGGNNSGNGGIPGYGMMPNTTTTGTGAGGKIGVTAFNMKQNKVMGGQGSKVNSFAFMDDPAKKRKDATNKKFEFVQDELKNEK